MAFSIAYENMYILFNIGLTVNLVPSQRGYSPLMVWGGMVVRVGGGWFYCVSTQEIERNKCWCLLVFLFLFFLFWPGTQAMDGASHI